MGDCGEERLFLQNGDEKGFADDDVADDFLKKVASAAPERASSSMPDESKIVIWGGKKIN